MQKESLRFLRDLISIPSPSGFEAGVQAVVRRRMQTYCDETRLDVHGNAIGIINPQAPIRIMLAGHCDEIGLMIMHIDDKGFLYFSTVGGVDPQVLISQRVKVHSRKGSVFGVIGRKPVHLMDSEEARKPLKFHELWIDIGAKDKKDARKYVSVGDYATIEGGLVEMKNDLVAGRGFDDRVGSFVVVETLRRLKGRKLKVAVFGVSTVQEEIGLRGARTSAFGIDPHIGIAIDVGLATDYPGGEPKITGECVMGKGVLLHRGPNINPVLEAMIENTAKKTRIPYQVTPEPRATGTDANAIQINKSGVAVALLSIPNRYMHTSVELVSLKDLDNASKLLAEFIAGLGGRLDFVPKP